MTLVCILIVPHHIVTDLSIESRCAPSDFINRDPFKNVLYYADLYRVDLSISHTIGGNKDADYPAAVELIEVDVAMDYLMA